MLVVVGSLNMDLVIRCQRLPEAGETLLGESFEVLPGGKGANQAYAAARLGDGRVKMIGQVSSDDFGNQLVGNLASAGVDVSGVNIQPVGSTGVAVITVDARGQNTIVVDGGANQKWPEDLEPYRQLIVGATQVLFQLEIPLRVVRVLAQMAKEEGAYTILDPAPAQALPEAFFDVIDLVTPNEEEARMLDKLPQAKTLFKRGAAGSCWRDLEVPAIPVKAVDTTAAGDTYNAGLAVALAEGKTMLEAMRFATVAAGLSVTKPGAQSSAPSRAEVDAYLASW